MTLVERILSCHPEISFSGQLRNFGQAGGQCEGRGGRTLGERERVILVCCVLPEKVGRDYWKYASVMTRSGGRFIEVSGELPTVP